LVSADVVEVSPPYDHADLTSLAAATVVYELVCLFAGGPPVASTIEQSTTEGR
jgi:agmatinase